MITYDELVRFAEWQKNRDCFARVNVNDGSIFIHLACTHEDVEQFNREQGETMEERETSP